MTKSLVSIIIPTYNSRKWLGEAVDSALGQTHPDCEVVVVDDGSSDGTQEWLTETYGERIRYFSQTNQGLAAARNKGLAEAQGEYVQFLDADDYISSTKIETLVSYLETHPEVDVAFSHCMLFYDGAPQEQYDWYRTDHYQDEDIFVAMLREGFILIHMPVTRTNSLTGVGGFDESLGAGTDWEMWLRLAWHGSKFIYVPGPALCYYRVRSKSMSHSLANSHDNMRVIDNVATYVTSPKDRKRIGLPKEHGRLRFRYGRTLVEQGHRVHGLFHMVLGAIVERRNLRYKIALITMAVFVGPENAEGVLKAILKRTNSSPGSHV